VQAGEAGGIT
jgi:translation initiation factor 5B